MKTKQLQSVEEIAEEWTEDEEKSERTAIKVALTQDRNTTHERIVEVLEGRLEAYAEQEHIRWAKWQNYMHSFLVWNQELEAWVLSHEQKYRWQRQIETTYSMLTEKEKESDREQVRPYINDYKSQLNTLFGKGEEL